MERSEGLCPHYNRIHYRRIFCLRGRCLQYYRTYDTISLSADFCPALLPGRIVLIYSLSFQVLNSEPVSRITLSATPLYSHPAYRLFHYFLIIQILSYLLYLSSDWLYVHILFPGQDLSYIYSLNPLLFYVIFSAES